MGYSPGLLTAEDEISVNIVPADDLGNGQKTVTAAGTAEVLATTTAIISVTIKALRANTGNIYVGDSGVDSANGHVLERGASVSMDVDDLADVYIDADTNGEGVSYLYLTE